MSRMSWPSSRGGGGGGGGNGMYIQQFPALNLREADVRRGAVKVMAQSPSGRTQTLKINADASGQYTTNFTPHEVGQWTVYYSAVARPGSIYCLASIAINL